HLHPPTNNSSIFNFDVGARAMRRILIRLAQYFSPLLLLGAFFLMLAWQIGEAIPLSRIIEIQQSDTPTIIDQSWSRRDIAQYKIESVIARQPEIIVIGSSRSIFFRETMFNLQPETFFNASVYRMQVEEIQQMINILEATDSLPNILILS